MVAIRRCTCPVNPAHILGQTPAPRGTFSGAGFQKGDILENITLTGQMTDITAQDCDVLLSALKSHLTRQASADAMGDLMGAIMLRGEDERNAFDMKRAEDKRRRQLEVNDEIETVTVLQAKIVMIKRRLLQDR